MGFPFTRMAPEKTVATGEQISMIPLNWTGERNYCLLRGLGEKPSPLGEDFSMLAVWKTTVNRAIPFMI